MTAHHGHLTPHRMDLRLLARAGKARTDSLEAGELALASAIDHLAGVRAAGGRVNVKLAAELLGVTRRTIYKRLNEQAARHG